jgi:hypothetical protein
MGKWAVLLLLAGMAWPARAAKNLSVEELDLLLANNQGKPDAHVAQQLGDVELSERVSPQRLAKWEKEFTGPRTREELMRLADEAAFLKTPAIDVMHIVPPDNDTQERMLELAADYAKTAFAKLPDFDAARETTRLEDAPMEEQGAAWRRNPLSMMNGRGEPKPLHAVGTATAAVTFRDGKEMREDAGEKNGAESVAPMALAPNEEFWTLMGVVIGDAARGQVAWSHWEQTAGDPAAVLHYAVPQDLSSLKVYVGAGAKIEDVTVAYHGEIAIDPATGGILRVSAVAEMPGMYEGTETATLVDYATVTLGDRTCLCPVHGVAFSKGPVAAAAHGAENAPAAVQTQVSDVVFAQYRLAEPAAKTAAGAIEQHGADEAGKGSPPSQMEGHSK